MITTAIEDDLAFSRPTRLSSATSLANQRAAYRSRACQAGRAFLAAVESILPVVRAGRAESERLGQVAEASVGAMKRIGVFRAFTPVRWGGLEMDPSSFFEGIILLGRADPAAAWIGGQLTVHSFEVALMSERAQADFWCGSPDTVASSSYAPLGRANAVEGGFVLQGTWTFSSGVDHAQWVMLGGGERNFLVPISDVSIDHASWDVEGLKGTGSKSVTLRDVFVPAHRVHELLDTFEGTDPGQATNPGALYRLSWMGMFNSTMSNAVIGMTLGGLEEFIAQTRVRMGRQGTGSPVVTNPFMHLRLARAMTMVQGVRTRHLSNWKDLFDQVCRGETASRAERMRVRFEASDAAGTCFEAFADLWQHAGAGAVAASNPMQNVFRDLMAMRNHGSAGRDSAASLYVGAMFDLPGPPINKSIDMGLLAYYR